MSKIQLPPKKDTEETKDKSNLKKISERKIQEIINKGGSPITRELADDKIKNFNLLVLESDLNIIGKLCDQRPKKPGRVIGFSKKDWFLEAVQEKIDREKRKFRL